MRLVYGAVALMMVAGGCTAETVQANDRPGAAAGETTPATKATPSPSPTVRTPIDGIWGLRQTAADVREHLTEHGYGDRADEFFRAEQVWEVDQWEWSFDQGAFTAKWMNPDGSWKVADYGTYTVEPQTVTLTFASGDPGSSTTFDYSVDGDTLRLDWRSHEGNQDVKGFPDEAFWRAYLSTPLARAS